ncbi:hypothetical protein F4819DRAFT_5782 [Hypoxylon fuscum]|nr:hypothetical protein F4819DRAFT_5782 [Hypoxylon fuscum]
MAVEWDMAAFAAALAIFVVPYIVRTLKTFYKSLQNRSRRHVRLQWQDIPEGRLHECSSLGPWYHSCVHSSGPHQQEKECWKSTTSLGTCFNRAWEISTRKPRYVKSIPETLPVGSQFVCTDARTVLAFVLCTVGEKKTSDWHPKSLSFKNTRVECETLNGNTTVVHIRGSFQSGRCQMLTKTEVEHMLSGYPPWYKEKFKTSAGIELEFPIESERDVPRAGWVIAVGLMDLSVDNQKPSVLYRCPDEPDEPGFRQNGRIFRQAVIRCRDHIRDHIAPHFPSNKDVEDAMKGLNWLIEQYTGSGMPEGDLGRKPGYSSRTLPRLRVSDCKFICDNFNKYGELDDRAKARLEPILFPAMSAALHGAYEVVQYLKDTGMELKIPPELLRLDREVWLRDCVTRLPIK